MMPFKRRYSILSLEIGLGERGQSALFGVSDKLPSTKLIDDYIKSCVPREGSAQPPQAYSLFINN